MFIGPPPSNETEPDFKPFDFQVSVPHFGIHEEEIADAEMLDEVPYFSMTSFAQHEEPVIELKGESEGSVVNQDTIIETDGIYSISDNLPYTKVLLNKEFKALVDSVLH